MLSTQSWGSGAPLVALHGFTQSSAVWEPLATQLGGRYRVVAPDVPGHGRSAAVTAGLWESASLLADTARAAPPAGAGGPATWLGYSMGGRLSLHVALAQPDVVTRLVLVSATAGLDTEAERTERVTADEALAQRVERDGVEAFVRWWLQRPLWATLPAAAAAVDSRLTNTATGLASSLRQTGTGRQDPLWGRLGAVDVPVLVTAGALDRAYAERAERLVDAIGANATLAVIDGAGHAVHLEQPEEWSAVVRAFLSDH